MPTYTILRKDNVANLVLDDSEINALLSQGFSIIDQIDADTHEEAKEKYNKKVELESNNQNSKNPSGMLTIMTFIYMGLCVLAALGCFSLGSKTYEPAMFYASGVGILLFGAFLFTASKTLVYIAESLEKGKLNS